MTGAVDLYIEGNTPLHRLDPRVKVFGLLTLFAALLAFNHPLYVACMTAGVLATALAGRAMANLWRLRVMFTILFLFSLVLWPLMVRTGTPAAHIGPLVVTREGLLYGMAVGMRLAAMVACGLIFLSTTRVEEFTAALHRLGVPFAMSFALSLAFRFVPTFVDSAYTIIQAQKSRGLDLESGNALARLRHHVPLLIPAVVGAVRTTDLLAMALEARGFGGFTPRTDYLELRARGADYAALILLLVVAAAAIWWRLAGHGAVLHRI
jgi:energy-coupling factor transport system permease protein